jgi:putative ABC transport system substrate-binding protein
VSGVRRRQLVFACSALLVVPSVVVAQPAGKVYRVGILSAGESAREASFRRGLRDLGYIEGGNLVLEIRHDAGNTAGLTERAAELARLKVDVIFASSSTYVHAARQVTSTIPIVFAAHNDPVGTGDAASLGHPGGNATGLTLMGTDLSVKQMQLLRQIVPGATRLAILWNPTTPSHAPALEQMDAAARSLGIQLRKVEAKLAGEMDSAFAAAKREGAQAVFVLASPMVTLEASLLANVAAKHRLPTMYSSREFAEAGGLIAYGPDRIDLFRRAAEYVDKILKGAKPGDLPIAQPTKLELIVNLKSAKTLGIKIPEAVLVRADALIQ